MPARTDWSVCDDPTAWSSIRAESDALPRLWYQEQADGSVCLKDTGRGCFKNELLSTCRFAYELPSRPRADDQPVCARLRKEASAAEKTLEVRLFSAAHAFDHYLGEWVVEDCVQSPNRVVLHLRRLRAQSEVLARAFSQKRRERSNSEARHRDAIQTLLPGWRVVHEPETTLALDAPLVVDGRLRPFSGDSYTHDYVAASPRGCKRLCIESKASAESLDEVAKAKCRALRDQSLNRVVAFLDHGPSLQYYDFGAPGTAADDERAFSATQAHDLRAALGLDPSPR